MQDFVFIIRNKYRKNLVIKKIIIKKYPIIKFIGNLCYQSKKNKALVYLQQNTILYLIYLTRVTVPL